MDAKNKRGDDTHQGQLISPRLDYSKALVVEPKINGHKRGDYNVKER